MVSYLQYFIHNIDHILELSFQHLQLTLMSVFTAIIIGVPVGILITYIKALNKPVLGFTNVVQSIPSIALLGFLIPFLGIGNIPAVFMVVIYSLMPIIKNTSTGLNNINDDLIEAATGIGMTRLQILLKVKLPLALPIIMAGVRISAVTAVGLVTFAAFIGSGGLGQLVYAGIRTLNSNQILAGAIPVCIIALSIDLLVSTIEKYVTPISLHNNMNNIDNKQIEKFKKKKILVICSTSILIISIFIFSLISIQPTTNTIIIGSKDDTETTIVSHMYAELIEAHTDINVIRHLNLGGTSIVFNSILHNEIDFYIEYTGTAYGSILNYEEVTNAQNTFDIVKTDFNELYNLQVLPQIGFNNTYALAITQDTANKFNIKTISDLQLVSSNLIFSPTFEFVNRHDGFIGLQEVYDINFESIISMDGASRYTAVANGQSHITDAYSTDGLILHFDLVLLEDDLEFFPPYYAVPVVREETLNTYPEIITVIDMLTGLLDDETITGLNYKVDVLNENPRDVAIEFLKYNNLI